jgi:hypothetical protein
MFQKHGLELPLGGVSAMKQPSPATYIIGSPPVMLGAWGTLGWLLYQWTQNGNVWPLVAIVACLIPPVMKADASVKAYKRWKREWDGLSGTQQRRAAPNRHVIGVTLTILAITLLMGQPVAVQHAAALLGTATGFIILIILGLSRVVKAGRRRRNTKPQIVTICVKRPVFGVPTLYDAYRALPDHCLQMG